MTDISTVAEVVGAILVGIALGLFVSVALFALIAPLFSKRFTNDPQNPDKVAFFTSVQPGQAKSIIRGGDFKRFLYNKDNWGPEGDPDDPMEYWELKKGKKQPGSNASGWANPFTAIWRIWAKYIRLTTGLQVIGIWPWQTVDTYDLPRVKEELITVGEGDGKKSEYILRARPSDRTDHVRIRPFTWYFVIDGAEIEQIPFRIEGSVQTIVRNPFRALYNVDSWNVVLDQGIRSTGRELVQAQYRLTDVIGAVLPDLLGPTSDETKQVQAERKNLYVAFAGGLKEKLEEYSQENDEDGKPQSLRELVSLDIIRVEITNFTPQLPAKELERLRAGIFARQEAIARQIQGVGESEALDKIMTVTAKHGDVGRLVVEREAMVRAGQAGNALIFDGGTGSNKTDVLLAAILTKLSKE